jgi:trimeric autotransporter adhesin
MNHLLSAAGLSLLLLAGAGHVSAQTTAFTYQGRLDVSGAPAEGLYELSVALWDSDSGGNALGGPVTVPNVPVTNGLFTVSLDFGLELFTGAPRWLQLGVRTNGAAFFTGLTPRQPLTAAPQALYATRSGLAAAATTAQTAAVAQAVEPASISSLSLKDDAVTSSKILDATITSADLSPGVLNGTFWSLAGNSGTTAGTQFVGTTDGQPLELKANNIRALRLEPGLNNTPNVVGGVPANQVTPGVRGAVIAGGGGPVGVDNATNHVGADWGTVSGGTGNRIHASAFFSGIGSGYNNQIGTFSSLGVIGGGIGNQIGAEARYTVISGGESNSVSSATIGTPGIWAVIAGGSNNRIQADALHSTIGGGSNNVIGSSLRAATISGGRNHAIHAQAWFATVGGGSGNIISNAAHYSTIGGGGGHFIQDQVGAATISGGFINEIHSKANHATIGGGRQNRILAGAEDSTISGGVLNTVLAGATNATIPGGLANSATNNAFAAGTHAKAIHTGAFVWADSTVADFASTAANQFSIRAGGGVRLGAPTPTLSFDSPNTSIQFPITAGANEPMIYMFSGGFLNADRMVLAHSPTSKNWGLQYQDSTDRFHFLGNGMNAVTVDILNRRLGINTNAPAHPVHHGSGAHLTAAGVWTSVSDRHAKEQFQPVDPVDMLERVAALPISQWRYKVERDGVRHIGPVAQDFHAAFGLGETDTAIGAVDADGVALAAIQGLNRKVEVRSQNSEVRIQRLEAENGELRARLERLERLLK